MLQLLSKKEERGGREEGEKCVVYKKGERRKEVSVLN